MTFERPEDFFGEWSVHLLGEVLPAEIGAGRVTVEAPGVVSWRAGWELDGDRLVVRGVDSRDVTFELEFGGVRSGVSKIELVRYVQGGKVRRDRDGSTIGVAGGPHHVELIYREARFVVTPADGGAQAAVVSGGEAERVATSTLIGDSRHVAQAAATGVGLSDPDEASTLGQALNRVAAAMPDSQLGRRGVFQHARLGDIGVIVPSVAPPATLTDLWRQARAATAGLEWWPLIVGEAWDYGWEHAPPPDEVLDAARRLDARSWLRERVTPNAQTTEPPDHDRSSALPDAAADLLAVDELLRDSTNSARPPDAADIGAVVVLVPAGSGPDALAAIGWSDGNKYSTVEHVAILDYFSREYGAELAAIGLAALDLVLRQPVGDRRRAHGAAQERLAYGDTTQSGTRYLYPGDEPDVAAATMVDHVWGFWWD